MSRLRLVWEGPEMGWVVKVRDRLKDRLRTGSGCLLEAPELEGRRRWQRKASFPWLLQMKHPPPPHPPPSPQKEN